MEYGENLQVQCDTLQTKVEQLYDDILNKCIDCQGWSSPTKVALQDVLECDCSCPLDKASKQALSILWGIR